MATLTTSGAVALKAGTNVNSTIIASGAAVSEAIAQAESFTTMTARIDFVDDYTTYDNNFKKVLDDAVSSYAAIALINYDMSGYTSRAEAQTMIDVNWARWNECMKLIKDKKATDEL